MSLARKIEEWVSSKLLLLLFTRFIETFVIFAIPGFATVWILQRKVINNLMYTLYGLCMVVAIVASILFWNNFMKVIRIRKQYYIMNFIPQLVFTIVTIVWYMKASASEALMDTVVFTRMFAGLRCLEFFGMKTMTSIIVMNVLMLLLCLLVGQISWKSAKEEEASLEEMKKEDEVDPTLAKIIYEQQKQQRELLDKEKNRGHETEDSQERSDQN